MDIKYKIVAVKPEDHSVVVRYFTDDFPESALVSVYGAEGEIIRCRTDKVFNLPIPCPSAEEAHRLFTASAPKAFFDKLRTLSDPLVDTSLDTLSGMVGATMVAVATPPARTFAESVEHYNKIMDAHMDTVAQGYGFSERLRFTVRAGYENSMQAVAIQYGAWRDVCKLGLEELIADVQRGDRQWPEDSAFIASLPAFTVAMPTRPTSVLQSAKSVRQAAVAAIKVTTASGKTFDGDEVSQTRMARAIIALEAMGTPSVKWVLANNVPTDVTVAELTEALALAGAAQAAVWSAPYVDVICREANQPTDRVSLATVSS